MRRFLPTVAVVAAVLAAGSSASFGSGPAIAAPSTIDIVAPTTQGTAAAQAPAIGMDIWFTSPGSVGPLGRVVVSGGFYCQRSVPATVRLEITLVQNNNAHGFAEGIGVCQGNRTWTATVQPDPQSPPFVSNQTMHAHVTMAITGNVAKHVGAEALLIKDKLSTKTNPTIVGNPDGTITVSGTYSCDAVYSPVIHLAVNTTERQADGSVVGGKALVTVACPAANQRWTATFSATTSTGNTALVSEFADYRKFTGVWASFDANGEQVISYEFCEHWNRDN